MVAGREPPGATRSTIAARLSSVRERNFVGRSAEQELWATALAAATPPFALLWITGPGGIGKSSLVRRFAGVAEGLGITPIMLDARPLISSPDQCLEALANALGLPGDRD